MRDGAEMKGYLGQMTGPELWTKKAHEEAEMIHVGAEFWRLGLREDRTLMYYDVRYQNLVSLLLDTASSLSSGGLDLAL